MADEFNSTGSWWDSARPTNTRFEPAAAGSSSSSSALGGFGWTTEMVSDVKPRTSIESVSVSGSSVHDSSTDLHMMGLCLSSQPMDWNQTLLSRGDNKSESGFRSMLQESLSSSSSYPTQESAWRAEESVASVRGFSLDQSAESPVTASSFHMDSAALYGNPSTYLQGILGPDNHPSSAPNRGLSFHQFGGSSNYGSVNPNEIMQLQQPAASSWNNNNNNNTSSSKVPQFLRSSPPKQLLFSNNAPFWNPAAAVSDVRPSFFSSSLQPQFPTSAPNFDEKPKNISEVGDSTSSVGKKSGSEAASKRPRNETTSTLPAFKVRKEKMGDRITALQQLVSPFGKTDTASVLSEAIEYIKFLHEQVNVLSTPYMKSGASTQHQQQNSDKSNEAEGPKQDLRSRGLCLVPVSSTFPVTHETTVDFWTPTFGGTFR